MTKGLLTLLNSKIRKLGTSTALSSVLAGTQLYTLRTQPTVEVEACMAVASISKEIHTFTFRIRFSRLVLVSLEELFMLQTMKVLLFQIRSLSKTSYLEDSAKIYSLKQVKAIWHSSEIALRAITTQSFSETEICCTWKTILFCQKIFEYLKFLCKNMQEAYTLSIPEVLLSKEATFSVDYKEQMEVEYTFISISISRVWSTF